ncbi:MAG TPA: hypothetical protein PK665_05045 [Ignavibacteriaceae bacterium]|nr:MAG: hypothetical protein BWY38_00907 [Ignavibacteria bacterium ADurb.Bin266]HQI40438.1 hypothetical protein [Ignavibacteriaceae bacterium]
MKSSLKLFTLLFIIVCLPYLTMAQNVSSEQGSELLTSMNQYLKAVNLEKGIISSKDNLKDFLSIAVEDNWNKDIRFWVSAQWGTKDYNGFISKQFELKGNDLTSIGNGNRPAKKSEGKYFGINFDGDNDYWVNSSFKSAQPFSVFIVFKTDETNAENVLLESAGTKTNQIKIENGKDGKPELVIESGGTFKIPGLTDGVNYILIEYNLKDSKVFINGKLAYNNSIGHSDFDGIQIGKGTVNNKYNYFKGSIYELGILQTTLNDQSRNTLFNFIKETYNLR